MGSFVPLNPNTNYILYVVVESSAITALLLDSTRSAIGVASLSYNSTGYYPGVVLGRSPSNVTCMSGYAIQLSSGGGPVQYFDSGHYGDWMDPPSPAAGLLGAITSGTRPVCSGDHGVALLKNEVMVDFTVEIPWTSTGEQGDVCVCVCVCYVHACMHVCVCV